MLIIQKGQRNTLALNINNNSRDYFVFYNVVFKHILSNEEKTYRIDTNDISEFAQNIRYCVIILHLETDDLNYEGQYDISIWGDGTQLVYKGIALATINEEVFVEYTSDNEGNDNYIYIED